MMHLKFSLIYKHSSRVEQHVLSQISHDLDLDGLVIDFSTLPNPNPSPNPNPNPNPCLVQTL
jgi:hypothetical protein